MPRPLTRGSGSSIATTTRADAGGDQGIGAGRRLAVMAAGLERDIGRGAARRLAGPRQRLGLGMRPAAGLRPAAPDDAPSLTMTQPTAGLGQVRPRSRRASASAARIWSASMGCIASREPSWSDGSLRRERLIAGWSKDEAASSWPQAGSLPVAAELADEVLEILGLAEIAIDRGEADIGDLVEVDSASITISPITVDGDLALARGFRAAARCR